MEISNERLLQGARNLKAKGYTPEQVDNWLQTKGSSLNAMKSFVNTSRLQPLSEEQKAKPQETNWGDIAVAGAKGFGQGVVSGLGRMASGATFGATDWIDRKTGANLAQLDESLQSSADDVGLGGLNKAANFVADVGGNIKGAGGKLATKIADKGIKGLKSIVANSAIGGGAYGLTSSDKLSQVPTNVISNAILGTAFGGGVYGAGKLGNFAYNVARPYANASINAAKETADRIGIGKLRELVDTANKKGRSILEVADDDVLSLAQEARQKSPQAYQNFKKASERYFETQVDRNADVVNNVFGNRGKYQNTDDIVRLAKEQAQPIYDKLQNIGDLNIANPKLTKDIVKNPFLRKEVGNVLSDPLYQAEYSGQKLSPTDWRVLDQTNRSINDKISAAVRAGENDKVRLLERQKYELLNRIDEIVPEYKVARGIYEAENKALKAQKIGEDTLFDRNTSADKLSRTMKDMTDYEKASLKVGAREKLLTTLESNENQTIGLKKLNNKQTQSKLKLVLGKQADDIINYADDEVKAMRNLNELNKGSQTSEKQNIRDKIGLLARIFKNPTGVIGEVGDALSSRANNASNDLLSQMLVERGGGQLNNAVDDYLKRAAMVEQLQRAVSPIPAIISNKASNN